MLPRITRCPKHQMECQYSRTMKEDRSIRSEILKAAIQADKSYRRFRADGLNHKLQVEQNHNG